MPIIEVNHVTKEYQLGQIESLKTTALNQWRRLTGQPVEERAPFKALNDVSFNIEAGEVVGIIGHNGAGKSTMLKLLANISKPSSGSITVKGKVAPLIEVGAGLVGDLTGRENIYLNGAILGIPKAEIKHKFDDIVAFAELEEFIDTPIKRYSSGMQVKLGFSIATSVESDVLIVDEVLAVGDLAFQRKCFNRMGNLIKRQGRTVLIVGHNIRQLEQICTRMLMLNKGQIAIDGKPNEVCTKFIQQSNDKIKNQQAAATNVEKSDEFELIKVEILDDAGANIEKIAHHQPFKIRVEFNLLQPTKNLVCFASIHTTDFVQITANETYKTPKDFDVGRHFFEMACASMIVLPGVYSIKLWIGVVDGQVKFVANNLANFQVFSDDYSIARLQDLGLFQLDASWNSGSLNLEGC
ncbi:MAG: ABC transporter ATP-binding protein [Candidatus Nitrotoga sp.]|nr:ABC transporter ATP-binding protein [Candidatus Nitrotoga sp.]